MLASVTDAIVGVDRAGNIALVNDRTEELFRYPEHELSGRPVEILLAEHSRSSHERHREAFMAAPQARPMGVGLDLVGRRKDGTELPADIALRPLTMAGPSYGGTLVAAVVRDVTERRRAELAARELRDARLRRRHALEINDTVVQGLTTAMYALERGSRPSALRALRSTLGAARDMMQNLLGDGVAISAGELVRESPATLDSAGEYETVVARPRRGGALPRIGLVLADDSTEISLALRAFAESLSGVDVVGEAADGAEAVRVVTECRPDVLLLDLAMPVLDGLQALPRIRQASPDTKVIVLSGSGRDQAAEQALAAGADAFVEKGGSLRKLATAYPDRCGVRHLRAAPGWRPPAGRRRTGPGPRTHRPRQPPPRRARRTGRADRKPPGLGRHPLGNHHRPRPAPHPAGAHQPDLQRGQVQPPRHPIGITVTESDETIDIAITDHGPGIGPQYRDRLFGKFARFGPQAGLGLGLYICREIAREHGGDVTLAGTGPAGTTFVVSLPRFID